MEGAGPQLGLPYILCPPPPMSPAKHVALTLTRPGPHPPRAGRPAPRPALPRVPCSLPRLQPQALLLSPRGWPYSPQRCRRAARRGPRPRVQGPGPRRRRLAPPRGPRRSRCSSSSRWERRRTEPLPLPLTLRTHPSDVTPPACPSHAMTALSPRLLSCLPVCPLDDTERGAETKPWRTALAADVPPPTAPYSSVVLQGWEPWNVEDSFADLGPSFSLPPKNLFFGSLVQ